MAILRVHDHDGSGLPPANAALECIDPEVGELLPFHADGTLVARDRQLVVAHLAACARCAEEERLMREVARGIATLRLDPSPAAALRPAWRWSGWRVGSTLAAAAAAALVIALGGAWRRERAALPARADVVALEQRLQQLEAKNALLAHQVAREQLRIESPLAGIPIASPPNF
jgi:anti-sigma-K factor RskA